MKELPLYDTVVLRSERRKDAAGQWRPSERDLLVQEVVRQVLAWPPEKQAAVREALGPPWMDVAVVVGVEPTRTEE